jgi:uncharacterized protein YukE
MSGLHCPHDLPGSVQRLTQLLNKLRDEQMSLKEFWKDSKATEFQHDYLETMEPILMGAIIALSEIHELYGETLKKLRESEMMS